MQKNAISQIIREEVLRAFVFSLAFFILMISGFIGVTYAAADGWIFGNILNSILASGDWSAPGDGTVENANKLGWSGASAYVKISGSRSCGGAQCIYGFDASGNIMCH
jgi:hypothetical protein